MGIPRAVRPEDDDDYTLPTPTDYEIRRIAMECASRMLRLHFAGTGFTSDLRKFEDVVSELEYYLKKSITGLK